MRHALFLCVLLAGCKPIMSPEEIRAAIDRCEKVNLVPHAWHENASPDVTHISCVPQSDHWVGL